MYKRLIIITLLLFIANTNAQAAPDGAGLYRQNCAACHGLQGSGGMGIPLSQSDFQKSVTDNYLAKTIRYGRPGRVMPPNDNLSDAQIKAIVQYIRSFADVQKSSESGLLVAGVKTKGKTLYDKHCAACHGANGEGGMGTGVTFSRPRDLPIVAPSLNNEGFLAAASDTMIKNTLMQGRANTPMPSFIKQGLSEQDINDIVSYVRSFENHASYKSPVSADEPATLEIESPYDLQTTIDNLLLAVKAANFRVIRQQTMESGMVAENMDSKNEVILYFCNFKMLNEVLAIDPRVGMFLPCRVTIIKTGNKVKVMTINPRYLSQIFNNSELDKACDNMYSIYTAILEEATL